MTQKLSNGLRIFLISAGILLTGYIVVKACGGGDWEWGDDTSGSNITPEVFADTTYAPFFYSDLFYYGINYDNAHDERFNTSNTEEWQSFLGKEVKKEAIAYLLTTADYNTIIATYNFYLGKNQLPDSMKRFSSSMHSGSAKEQSFLQYLTIAKACESFAVDNVRDSWDYDTRAKKPVTPPPFDNVQTIEKLMQKESQDFIKERYWFQVVRYNFFNDLPSCAASFENNKKNFSHSVTYYRAMGYAAGAYYKQKNYSKANYYYSLMYAANDPLKVVSYWSFHPQEEADWQQTLAMCANDKERITLWQMVGIGYADEMRSMKEIYKLNPADPTIDLLLLRSVNKLESQSYDTSIHINATFEWCKKITDDGKVSNPFLWNVSTGYLAFMQQDYANAKKYYTLAEKKMPNTTLAKNQVRLLTLLLKVESLKTITAADEQALLPDFQWLYKLTDSTAPTFRFYTAQGRIKSSLAKKYAKQGDFVKSECFVSTTAFYASDKKIDELKVYLNKSNPTGFDVLARSFSAKNTDDLWEVQAVKATYRDDIDAAISMMEKAGKNSEVVLLGNPFNGKISDCHDCDHAQKQKVKYTKLSFLKKMKELKDNVTAKNDVYNNALLLANGYYNISHFGNARYFYEGAVIGAGQSSPYDIDSMFKTMLTDNALSTKYYRLALQTATDDEQKAKCLYMVSKCQRNDWYNQMFYTDRKNDPEYGNNSNIDFITWNAFSALRKYKNTQYYKDVIRECGYFRTAMAK
jgi:hypothetical protein